MSLTHFSLLDLLQHQSLRRFPPELEAAFYEDLYQRTIRLTQIAMLGVSIPTAAFAILDVWAAPSSWLVFWAIRIGIVVLFILLTLALRLPSLKSWFLWITTSAGFVFVLGIAMMIGFSQPQELSFQVYFVGIVIAIVGAPAVFGFLFWQSLILGIASISLYSWIAIVMQGLLSIPESRVQFLAAIFFLVGGFWVGVTHGYHNERLHRQNFLQSCIIERQRLEAENLREESEQLLLNILPSEIADQLKAQTKPQIIAEDFPQASILFADIVNFAVISAQMKPTELVEFLNQVFSHFDLLTDKYGLEKIKTIGDCYMVAAGVPRPRPDHAHALARMALDIRNYSASQEIYGERLNFRIGINSGPVTAGVIGRRKFIYDLWGDAVNTASRMESHGLGGKIQVTEATYQLIQADFLCQPRGLVSIKGKGEIPVYLLLDAKPKLLELGGA